jgi:drug/metabolite transporter (DMT)-like permease
MQKQWINFGLLVSLWFVWGYGWIVTKLGLPYVGVFDFAMWRTLIGVVTLGVLMVFTGRSLRPTPFWPTFWLGLAQTAGFTSLTNFALVAGGAGKVAVLAFTMPFWTVLLARLFLHDPISRRQGLAVALAFIGLVGILEPWHLHDNLLSDLLALLSGVVWALAAIHVKRLRQKVELDTLALTFWQMVWGFWPMLLIALWAGEPPAQWAEPAFWSALLFLGTLAGGAGWLVWMILLERLPASTAGLGVLAIPVVALIASAWQLGEVPNLSESLGILFIVLSLGLVVRNTNAEPPAQSHQI